MKRLSIEAEQIMKERFGKDKQQKKMESHMSVM